MKRSPLARRTPLQSKGRLERGAPSLPRRTRVKPQSAKRETDAALRRAVVAQLLAEFPRCQAWWVCQGAPAVEVHERLSRARGGSITDPRHGHMVTICRACHHLATTEPAEAERRRMLLPSWHRCPAVGPC